MGKVGLHAKIKVRINKSVKHEAASVGTANPASVSDKGYQVCVAYDGNMAIEMTRENIFDIMLIDLKLPSLNGLETYLAIRDIRPNVVAIIISGYLQEMSELARQAIRESAYTCLEKPINMDKLVELLERIREQKARGTLEKPG